MHIEYEVTLIERGQTLTIRREGWVERSDVSRYPTEIAKAADDAWLALITQAKGAETVGEGRDA